MRILLAGRTDMLLETGNLLLENGHEIAGIITCRAAIEYSANEDDFSHYADDLKVPFFQTQKINSTNCKHFVEQLGHIDVTVSINWIGIMGEKFISNFKLGVLNAHGGDLPRYRGNACQAWAIINGESKIGLCIHKMIAGVLDSGDIISRSYFPIDINTRVGQVYSWMRIEIPQLFLQAINALDGNADYILEEQSKDPAKTLRCYPRKPEDGQIDWKQSSESIIRLVNASSEPFSGSFCFDEEGVKIIIWRARVHEDEEAYSGIPGQITSLNKENSTLHVLTGKGKIEISEIERNGVRDKPTRFFSSIRSRLK